MSSGWECRHKRGGGNEGARVLPAFEHGCECVRGCEREVTAQCGSGIGGGERIGDPVRASDVLVFLFVLQHKFCIAGHAREVGWVRLQSRP